MTITLRILGFHNCTSCARKVRTALGRIGVELVELNRESGNVTVVSAENPEVIRSALERQLKKSVIVLSWELVPTNQNPNHVLPYEVATNPALYLQEVGQVVLGLAEFLDGVEITRSNTTTINFIHRETPPVVRREHVDYNGFQIREADVDQYASPRPPPRTPPWTTTEPSAPLMPAAEQTVYGYPPGYYGVSTCRNHDHPNGCCNIT